MVETLWKTRIRLDIAYIGTKYIGWQAQVRGKTVQSVIEKVLRKFYGRGIKLVGAGRTDAGVHAKHQVGHTDIPHNRIPIEKLADILNGKLPEDISILRACQVDKTFHARRSAVEREYHYRIYTAPLRDPFREPYAWHFRGARRLSIQTMRNEASKWIGRHDFRRFSTREPEDKTTVRNMKKITIRKAGDEIYFTFIANAFLRRMVRRFVSYLVDRGAGKKITGPKSSAPANGLTLVNIKYKNR